MIKIHNKHFKMFYFFCSETIIPQSKEIAITASETHSGISIKSCKIIF
jgi:hypothetical protein